MVVLKLSGADLCTSPILITMFNLHNKFIKYFIDEGIKSNLYLGNLIIKIYYHKTVQNY